MLLSPASTSSGRGGALTLTIFPAMLLPPTSSRSGRDGAVTPLSGTSCPDTKSGTSCLDSPHTQSTTYPNLVSNHTYFHFAKRPQVQYSYRSSKFPPCSPSHNPASNSSITPPFTHPPNHPYKLPTITTSTQPTPTPSHTWDIPGRLGKPHGSHCTCIQGWIPLPSPVPDAVVYPVMHRC